MQSDQEVSSARGVSASTPTQPIAANTADNLSDCLVDPVQIFQQVVDRVDRRIGDLLAAAPASNPSLDTLRSWYRAARELGRSQNYLNRVAVVATDFKQGEPLADKAVAVMQADLQAHSKNLAIIEQIGQLSDRDFLQLHQAVANHFKAAPPSPPSVTDQQFIQSEINQLVAQINHLWSKQAEQVALVESMQKNPFRIWNHKYDVALAQVQQTTGLISSSITQK